MLFQADHPVHLRWKSGQGQDRSSRGGLYRISETGLTVRLKSKPNEDNAPKIGERVRAEAGEFYGNHLTVFRGAVVSVDSGLVRIRFDGQIDEVQRRKYPRAAVSFLFATAKLLGEERKRFIVVHPIDLSGGGVRIKHQIPLEVGERFQLTLRLSRSVTLTPVAEVVETWN